MARLKTVTRSSKLGSEERAAAINALKTKELDILVVGTDGSRVYTVEGNSGDACKIKSYSLTYECIKGYGLMNW